MTGMDFQRKANRNSTAFKSMSVYKQKMDSLHVQRYHRDTAGLRTLNQGWFAYDSKGRVILNIDYTCNTMDDQYIWYKDTTTFYADNKPSMQAHYSRKQVSEPWNLESRYETFYDAGGNDTLSIYNQEDWETGESYIAKMIKYYDTDNRCSSWISYIRNDTTGVWEKRNQSEQTYDSAGNVVMISSYDWSSETGTWIQTGRNESTFDEAGHQTSVESYYYSSIDQVWRGSWREEDAFDSQGNQILRIDFSWNGDTNLWEPQMKNTWAFNSDGQETDFAYYSWDAEKNDYLPVYRMTQTYNTNGNLAEAGGFLWDTGSNQWMPESKSALSYDSNGRDTLEVYSYFDPLTGIWNEDSRSELEYDDYGNLVFSLDQASKDSTGAWRSKFKADYSYNYSFTAGEALTPYEWYGIPPVNLLVRSVGQLWVEASGTWIDYMVSDYWYSEFAGISSSPAIHLSSVRVYPNPAVGFIMVDMDPAGEPAQFEMVDLSGRKVISKNMSGVRNQLSISDLPAGLYLYHITRNGETYRGKILKR